ncbi:hypothetical protein ONZ43_g880 [Nemania bipapillata]|uniref:Uncharacterized protein n=1 Tax=Nemania bipapillata TaxID=110536 RepID=A0ACC2J6F6_9PEZI|nr:hypothetical protein ONZ43_g880 [Nemania bipapillata]
MAAISAASGPTSLNPPGDAQDEYAGWHHTSNGHTETSINHPFPDYEAVNSPQSAPIAQNEAADGYFTLRESRSNSRVGSVPQTKRAKDGSILTYDDENSKWIHRDKLAKIESEELQAADAEVMSWDLRRPEEIAEDPGEYWVSNDSGKGTRIPVAKVSPAPLPSDYIDRNAPVQRKSSFPHFDEEASIVYPKTRSRSGSSANVLDDSPNGQPGKRSVTDGSPTKKTTTAPLAKRLQQEKWEQEGSFGSVYDKEFRPLNKDTFTKPTESEKPQEAEEPQDEWPLKPEARVPTPSRPGTSSYSTMPKIQDTPTMSPLGSPRPIQQMQTQTSAVIKIPDPPEQPKEKTDEAGCGCCTVM